MPYSDPEKRRAAQRRYVRRKRQREREARAALNRSPAMERPDGVLPWLGSLTVTQGEGAGGALRLFPWERDWIAGLERSRRRYRGAVGRPRSWQDYVDGLAWRGSGGGTVGGPSRVGADRRVHVQASAGCVLSRARVHAADHRGGPGAVAGARFSTVRADRGPGVRRGARSARGGPRLPAWTGSRSRDR